MAAIMRFFIGKFQAFQSCGVMDSVSAGAILYLIAFEKPLEQCQHGYVPSFNFSASGEGQYGISTPCNKGDEMADKCRRAV